MERALIFAAIGEAVTGIMLLLVPGFVAEMLLGTDVTGSGVMVARVAGMALIGLAAACWPGPASLGMLIYGILVALYLSWLGAAQAVAGPLLWPAVALHAVLAVFLGINVKRERKTDAKS